MHGSRQDLKTWLVAAWMLVTDKRGVSATYLANDQGIRLETAWNMLHKLRAAMVDPDRTLLRGRIECDATLIGGARHGGGSGRWKGAQQVVMGAVEVHEKHTPGRIRLKHVPEETKVEVMKFLRDNVEDGAKVTTDAKNVYDALDELGMAHEVQSVARGDDPKDVLKTFHMAMSNLKKILMGTYKGAIGHEHLQAYLNEFTFRFNRRHNLHAGFQSILGIAAKVTAPTYEGLYKGTFVHANPAKRAVRRRA